MFGLVLLVRNEFEVLWFLDKIFLKPMLCSEDLSTYFSLKALLCGLLCGKISNGIAYNNDGVLISAAA